MYVRMDYIIKMKVILEHYDYKILSASIKSASLNLS